MTRAATGALLLAGSLLGWAGGAAADEPGGAAPAAPPAEVRPPSDGRPPLELCVLAEAAVSAGWAGRGVTPLGGRAGVRFATLEAVVSVDSLGARHAQRVDSNSLVLVGAGPTVEVRGWLVHALLGLGARAYAYEDVWGTGRATGTIGALGLRAGAARRFPLARLVTARLGIDGTLAWTPRDRDRFRQAEIGGWIGLVSVTAGVELGGPLR